MNKSTSIPNKNKRMSPSSILTKYKPYLGHNGFIRSCEEAIWFSSMMPKITHNIERCILLNIIAATACSDSPPIIDRFLNSGGWNTLDLWFNQYLKEKNTSLLILMIKILDKLPITIQRLRSVTIGKSLKAASKLPDSKLKQCSKLLVKRWKEVVLESKNGPNNKDLSKHADDSTPSDCNYTKVKRSRSTEKNETPTKLTKDEPTNNFIKSLDVLGDIRKPTSLYISEDNLENESKSDEEYIDEPIPETEITDINEALIENNEDNGFQSELMEENYLDIDQNNTTTSLDNGLETSPKVMTKKRKSVSWKEDSELVSIKYFEKNEYTIGLSVNNPMSNDENCTNDSLNNNELKLIWDKLILVDHDSISPIKSFGGSSNEKVLQSKCEDTFLNMFNLTDGQLIRNKESPIEPEGDDVGVGIKPKVAVPQVIANDNLSRPVRYSYIANPRIPTTYGMNPLAQPSLPHRNPYFNERNDNGHRNPGRPRIRMRGFDLNRFEPINLKPSFIRPDNTLCVDNENNINRPPYMENQQRIPFITNQLHSQASFDERSTPNFRQPFSTRGKPRYNPNNVNCNRPRSQISNHSNENFNRITTTDRCNGGNGDINFGKPRASFIQSNSHINIKHDSNSVMTSSNNNKFVKTVKCRVHSSGGVCRFGDNCKFIHDNSI